MKIAINANILRRDVMGQKRYTYHLISGLSKILGSDDSLILINNSFKLKNTQHPSLPPGLSDKCIYKNIILSRKLHDFFQYTIGIPRIEHLTGHIDVYHSTWVDVAVHGRHAFPATKASKVVTIHDVSIKKIPEGYFEPVIHSMYDSYIRNSAADADAIIVDSDSTERDLIGNYEIKKASIHRVYLAAAPGFMPVKETDEVLDRCSHITSGRPFFLYAGVLSKHKNVAGIIQAFDIFRSRYSEQFRLVICGGDGWRHEEIHDAAKNSAFRDSIIFTGHVEDELLPLLMNGATGFVMPSYYEGFGLPALEAMACGTPVIASNVSSLPEIVGDAGLLVDPDDTDAIAHAMFRIADDAQLRAELSEKSLARSAAFSWERCARETLEVYRSL